MNPLEKINQTIDNRIAHWEKQYEDSGYGGGSQIVEMCVLQELKELKKLLDDKE